MYKSIRKKVASTVSEIEKSEDFAWGKWLKEPSLAEHLVEGFETSLLDTNQYNSWIEKPAFQKKVFDFKEIFVFPENKNLRPKKSKTHTVFFDLPKTELKKLKLFDKEFKFEHKPEKVDFNNFSLKLKEIKWDFSQTKVEQKLWELKPNILKIDLLNSDNLSINKYSSQESKVEFKAISSPLKIYKVKITSLDRIKLSKIYYLKNINLHDVRILRESLSLIINPAIQKEELKYFITEEDRLPEVLPEEKTDTEDISVETGESFEVQKNEVTDKSIEQQMSEILASDQPDVNYINENDPVQKSSSDENEEKSVSNEIRSENIEEIDRRAEEELKPELSVEAEKSKETELNNSPKSESAGIEEEEESEKDDNDEGEYEFDSLYFFQERGAEFLLDNKRAALFDEMGMGKTIQVIAAVKNQIANKKIKSAVIVCEQSEVGSRGKIPGDTDGWLGHIHKKAPELKVESAGGTTQGRSKLWKNLPEIMVISYEAFLFDLEEKNVTDSKELKKNVCFIFDEVQNLFENKNFNKQKFTKSLNPKYLWLTSSYPEADLKDKIDDIFKEKLSINNYLRRTRKEVGSDLPGITWQNKWLTLDDEQVEEYNEAFANAKEKVQWFLESGNPLRFNANVFTLIHQLKQVYNFSEKKGNSRKTKILLDQVNQIAKNQEKVVIFTQYEKAGIKKIEEVLKKNNIKFLSYAPGMSTKEMETVLKKFSSSSITALVIGVKPSRVKIPSGNISYVIHFDVWWNPTSLWQTEEVVYGSSKDNEKRSLNVYTYLMKDTIEERIHSLLHKKGFLNKHVMETVNPDSITEMITNPEWLDIFDMPDEQFKQRYQKGLLETERRIDNYSIPEFMERGKNFLNKLGYKNLDASESKTGDSFDIRGIFKKSKFDQQICARFLLKNSVNEDEVKTHLTELKEITNNGKYYLITKGTFEGNEVTRSNEALIDRNLLSNYFYQFIII